jgi:hypothetical protein
MIQAKEYPEKNNEIAKYHICGIVDKEKKLYLCLLKIIV